jgi:trehalose 6-phosphate phosphatase
VPARTTIRNPVNDNAAHAPVELFDPRRFAFLLDVDGTLVEIAPTPRSVQVPPSLRRDLERLATLTDGATALVSGRSLDELDRLFGPLQLTMVGGHGAEIRFWRDGHANVQSAPPLGTSLRARLAAIEAIDSRLIVEDKGYSVALHYRRAPEREAAVRKAVAALEPEISAQDLEILDGKAVIEIKRPDIDKGTGVRALLAQAPFLRRRPVYIGDDITDEDAFAVLPEFDGIAISVGRSIVGVTRRFDGPPAVRRWIAELLSSHDRPGVSDC